MDMARIIADLLVLDKRPYESHPRAETSSADESVLKRGEGI
jgi:hypothetical protein